MEVLPVGYYKPASRRTRWVTLRGSRGAGGSPNRGGAGRLGQIGALVYATGASIYFGKTAQRVQEAHTVSHLQRALPGRSGGSGLWAGGAGDAGR